MSHKIIVVSYDYAISGEVLANCLSPSFTLLLHMQAVGARHKSIADQDWPVSHQALSRRLVQEISTIYTLYADLWSHNYL